jgi:hypothetical protein
MCHGYRIDEREARYAFEEERAEEPPEAFAEPETEPEEPEEERPLLTADD